MFIRDESIASRGASKIGSCLMKYIEEKVAMDAQSVTTTFNDSCGGQNRNFKISALLIYLVVKPKMSATLNFMQSGHSFLPNDADFGVREKAKKTSGGVLVPEHWMDVVAKALKRNSFIVGLVQMQSSDFIDLTAMSKQLCNRKKDTDGNVVCKLRYKYFSFGGRHVGFPTSGLVVEHCR
jgi:hypothetical protein